MNIPSNMPLNVHTQFGAQDSGEYMAENKPSKAKETAKQVLRGAGTSLAIFSAFEVADCFQQRIMDKDVKNMKQAFTKVLNAGGGAKGIAVRGALWVGVIAGVNLLLNLNRNNKS